MRFFIAILAIACTAAGAQPMPPLPTNAPSTNWTGTNWKPEFYLTAPKGARTTNIVLTMGPWAPQFGTPSAMIMTCYRNGAFFATHSYPPTNQFVVKHADVTACWTFTVTAQVYYTPPSNVAMWCSTNLLPFVSINGSKASYNWWGVTNKSYQILAGSSPSTLTNLGITLPGADGLCNHTEAIQPSRFYLLCHQ